MAAFATASLMPYAYASSRCTWTTLIKNAQGQTAEVSIAVPTTHPQNPSYDVEHYGCLTSSEVAWLMTSPVEATGTMPVIAATANTSYLVSAGMVYSWATL